VREESLVEIYTREQLWAWRQEQPREVSIAFAARAALRVLPILWGAQAGVEDDFLADVVLWVFRATALAWAAAKYPSQATRLRSARAFGAVAVRADTVRTAAARAAAMAAADAVRTVHESMNAATAVGVSAATTAAIDAAATAVTAANNHAFWSAISFDATRVEAGVAASVIAGLPLWPQDQPDELQSLWQEMRTALLAAGEYWDVWTDWYEARIAGGVGDEEHELAYLRIEEGLWDQGPAAVNAEIKRRMPDRSAALDTTEAPDEAAFTGDVAPVPLVADSISSLGASAGEPTLEPGPVLQVTKRGLEIISQPIGTDFDEQLQKALHDRLRRLLSTLKDATARVANAHPALAHLISEYSELVEQPFDQLDVASLWAVGAGLLAFRAAFTNQSTSTMTEPLEPALLALLQQAAAIHSGFILGFPKGRELTDRADRLPLSPEIIAQIAPSTHRILEELARARNFVELRTRKFLAVIDESLIVHGWQTARIGHNAYVLTRNSIIALGKVLIWANSRLATVAGGIVLSYVDPGFQVTQYIIQFMFENAQTILSFAEPFPELRSWICFLIDHIDREK
jgi:hypothetical protein